MQRLEVSGAVRAIYGSGVKRLSGATYAFHQCRFLILIFFESSATLIFLLPSAVTADSSILKYTIVLFVHLLHFNTSVFFFASISSRLYKNTFTQVSLYSKVLNATTSKPLKLTVNFPQCLPIRLHCVVFKASLPQNILKIN